MSKNSPPCLYFIIYYYFKKNAIPSSDGLFIPYHTANNILTRRLYFFSKSVHYKILKEMEFKYDLIKRIGSKNGKNINFELVLKLNERDENKLKEAISLLPN